MASSHLAAEQSRRRDRYHESGHAIAAVIRQGYVKSMGFSFEVETTTDLKSADIAFMARAGPWAQAYWEGNCTLDRIMELLQTQSFVDWKVYEKARDQYRANDIDIDRVAFQAEIAFTEDRPRPRNLPPVGPPEHGWHAELTNAWPQIRQLAESLLKGDAPIRLSNGQELVLDDNRAYEYWWDPREPSVGDE